MAAPPPSSHNAVRDEIHSDSSSKKRKASDEATHPTGPPGFSEMRPPSQPREESSSKHSEPDVRSLLESPLPLDREELIRRIIALNPAKYEEKLSQDIHTLTRSTTDNLFAVSPFFVAS